VDTLAEVTVVICSGSIEVVGSSLSVALSLLLAVEVAEVVVIASFSISVLDGSKVLSDFPVAQ
jgi:hypothetical protein